MIFLLIYAFIICLYANYDLIIINLIINYALHARLTLLDDVNEFVSEQIES